MKDVVCGMEADGNSGFSSEYNGKIYHFCSKSCKDKFDKNPAEYSNNND